MKLNPHFPPYGPYPWDKWYTKYLVKIVHILRLAK